MSIENCELCNKESTPWVHVNGHICEDCYHHSKNSNWISVKDRLPENGQYVIVWDHGYASDFVTMARFESNKFWNDAFDRKSNVSHWMPLPETPNE